MTFEQPIFLLSLLLLPLVALFIFWTNRRREADLARLGDPALITQLSSANPRTRRWKTALWLCALALMLVALARPQWGTQPQLVEQRGVQAMIVLDVSASMLAQDVQPDRLSRARAILGSLLEELEGNEVGLTLFSGAAFIQLPLTNDLEVVQRSLFTAGPEAISRPGSEIGAALRTALGGFDTQRARQQVILLASDGETPDAEAALQAAREAAGAGVRIYTLGLGSAEGALVPEYNTAGERIGYKRTVTGETVISRLDEALLVQLADPGGGAYFSASEAGGLAAVLARLQSDASITQAENVPVERFPLLLLPAVLLLLAAEALPERKPGRSQEAKP